MTLRTSQPLIRLLTLLALLLVALVVALPITASAQTELGSVTIKKLPTSLDTPGVHPVRFELTGGDLTAPLVLYSDTDTVRFDALTPGTYHVRELATRTGDIARATVAPTTVTIPSGELFDVALHPKPQPLTLTLSADVNAVTPGTKFTYILNGTVPLPDTNEQLHRYVLHNELSTGVTLAGGHTMQLVTGSRSIQLIEGEHYTVTTSGDNIITATFTPAGLELLARERTDHADVLVRFTYSVQATRDMQAGSHLLNIAHLYPDGFPLDGAESVTSNEHILPVTNQSGLIIPILPLFPGSFFPGSPDSNTPGLPGPTAEPSPGNDSLSNDSSTIAGHQRTPDRPVRNDALASTGASILGTVALGAILSLIGITFYMRGRRVH